MIKIYRILIRSKLDYGCMVYNTAKTTTLKTIDTIQHSAIRLASGAFRTSPTTSLQIIAAEPPLKYRRAQLSLKYISNISTNTNHPLFPYIFIKENNKLQIKKSTPTHNILHQSCNDLNLTIPIMESKAYSPPPWKIQKPTVNTQLGKYPKENTTKDIYKQTLKQLKQEYINHEEIYTDASQIENKTGTAVVTAAQVFKYKLPQLTSIFTAEAFGILKSLQIIHGKEDNQKNYLILSDSLSCIIAIKAIFPKNKLIQDIQQTLHKLEEKNMSVVFIWIPSHVGISGNEKADTAAKDAAMNTTDITKLPTQLTDYTPTIKTKSGENGHSSGTTQIITNLEL